jgi:MFS family permease
MFAGVAFIRRNPIVLGAISLDLFAVLFGGATALLPVFARDVFAVGPWGLGIMRAAPGIGALVMSLVLARRPLRANVGRTMFATVTIFGLATVAFALSTSPIVAVIALTIVGASDMISVVIRETLVQIQTPDEMRGRVSAVNSLFVGTSNQLGEFESGVTAAWFGTVPSVLIGGIATVMIVLLWRRLFPALFHVESFAQRDQPRVR